MLLSPATIARRFLGRSSPRGIRTSDTFIVSYPKSGGTWFFTLVANALHGTPERPLDIFSARNHIPDINGPHFQNEPLTAYADLPDPRFFFVHARPDRAFPRVIYVLRDVRDVLVSYYHWAKMRRPGFELTLEQFVRSDEFWPCRWDEHVDGWLGGAHGVPMVVLRYEDLLTDTVEQLRRALSFCGHEVTDERLRFAVEASSFENMRKAEDGNEQYAQKKLDKAERFVRKGKAGGWVDELDEGLIRAIEEKYGDTMRRMNYL